MRRRQPGLSIDDLLTLARSFRQQAKDARKLGDAFKAEKFDRKADDYEERAKVAGDKLKPRPRI